MWQSHLPTELKSLIMKKILLLSIAILSFTVNSKAQLMTCSDFCVLNINNVDTINNTLDVTIYNGDSVFVNYPIVVVTDAAGDTIANINSLFYFFGHLAGDTLVHTIPTTADSIPTGFTGTVYYDDPMDSIAPCVYSYPMTCTVGINEIASNVSFNIYPNPASTTINLDLRELNNTGTIIKLYDVTGKIVKTISTTEQTLSIDRGNLRSGIYFVQVMFGDRVLTKKIVLE